MITLTAEQAQQIEEALHNVGNALMCLTATRKLRPMYQEMRDDAVECCNEALAAVRAARAQEQAEQDLDTCPGCGGVADNGHDREFPPNPYYCTKCSEQEAAKELRIYQEQMKAAPVSAKREWVELTLQELQACCGGELSHGVSVHAVIAAFKEKNK